MAKTSLTPWELIRETWSEYLRTWNESIKVSIWFLYCGLAYFTLYLMIKIAPLMIYIGPLVAVGILAIWSWTIIRLMKTELHEKNSKPDLTPEGMRKSWKLVPPLLWVGILQACAIFGSAIPFALWQFTAPYYLSRTFNITLFSIISWMLLIPAIYVGIRLSFSQFVALDMEKRGLDALATSGKLIQGKWWFTFSRQLLAAVIFGGIVWLGSSILFLILGLIVGTDKLLLLSEPTLMDPVLQGIRALVEGLIQALMMPLFVLFAAKLYQTVRDAK